MEASTATGLRRTQEGAKGDCEPSPSIGFPRDPSSVFPNVSATESLFTCVVQEHQDFLLSTQVSALNPPVIAPLRKILDAWMAKAKVTDGCWIFQAGFTRKEHPESLLDAAKLTPSSPQNVLRDVIAPALEKVKVEWHGFHAFRRGLATNLRSLGVDDLTIKEILRHSDVSVTRASYIKRIDEKSVEAMDRFEAELRKPVQSVKGKGKGPKADSVVLVGMA